MEPLNSILTGYPSFQPNQVLTSKHLNDLGNYLEQQHRLTRQKLIGIGIVCGLGVQLETSGTDSTITISKGVGITSEGYLICLSEDTVCTHIRPFENRANYSSFMPATETDPSYSIQELLTASEAERYSDSEILAAGHVSGNLIVVLYLEILETAINKCLDESCDEKGKNWELIIRKLLVAQNDMEAIITSSPGIPDSMEMDKYFNPEYELKEVLVTRPTNLSDISSFDNFVKYYHGPVIKSEAIKVANALYRLYELYQPLFEKQLGSTNPFEGFDLDDRNNHLASMLLNIIDIDSDHNRLAVQYVYDFILDLKATYHELVCKLFELTSSCSPETQIFPQHLMLGKPRTKPIGKFDPELVYPPSIFRNHFASSPIYAHQSDLLLSIKQLIQRLVLMIDLFRISELLNVDADLRITPSKDCSAPLGKQAIPFYYSLGRGGQFLRYWDFETSKRNWTSRLLGYHTDNNVDSSSLNYDICQYPKLRIEGHIGMTLQKAIEQLKELRQKYNLPFELMTLKLNDSNNYLLADDSLIADLQGQYLVLRNELVCCLRDLRQILQKRLKLLDDENVFHPLLIAYFFFVLNESRGVPHPSRIKSILEDYFPEFYKLYIQALDALANELPTDLKEFNVERFQAAHNLVHAMSTLVKSFINTWGYIPPTRWPAGSEGSDSSLLLRSRFTDLLSLVLNYVELFIDQIGENCLRAKFETLYGLFVKRVKRVGNFSNFTEDVQGLEHIAGTIKGGTFILVYEDRNSSPGGNDENQTNNIDTLKNSFYSITEKFFNEKLRLVQKNDQWEFKYDALSAFCKIAEYSPPKSQERIHLHSKSNFLVVGDFYLPGTVPDSCLEVEAVEVCAKEGRNNLPDLNSFIEQLSNDISKDAANQKGEFYQFLNTYQLLNLL